MRAPHYKRFSGRAPEAYQRVARWASGCVRINVFFTRWISGASKEVHAEMVALQHPTSVTDKKAVSSAWWIISIAASELLRWTSHKHSVPRNLFFSCTMLFEALPVEHLIPVFRNFGKVLHEIKLVRNRWSWFESKVHMISKHKLTWGPIKCEAD